MILLPIVQPLSFNITNFSNTESASPIEYAGVAKTENGTVVLNPLINGGVGRAICVQPLRLKKSSNEDVTDFSTRFSFSINAPNKTNYADGFAFYVPTSALHTCIALVTKFIAHKQFLAIQFLININCPNSLHLLH